MDTNIIRFHCSIDTENEFLEILETLNIDFHFFSSTLVQDPGCRAVEITAKDTIEFNFIVSLKLLFEKRNLILRKEGKK